MATEALPPMPEPEDPLAAAANVGTATEPEAAKVSSPEELAAYGGAAIVADPANASEADPEQANGGTATDPTPVVTLPTAPVEVTP
jgi:hypothetical protein